MDNKTKSVVKNGLLWLGAFTLYRLYRLYEVGQSISYKPVGVSFVRNGTLNDFVVRVKIELMNPQNTVVKTNGIEGKLLIKGQPIGYFSSQPFDINAGITYFDLDFRVDAKNIGVQLIQAISKKQVPELFVEMKVKLPFFSTIETFSVNPATVPQNQIFVK